MLDAQVRIGPEAHLQCDWWSVVEQLHCNLVRGRLLFWSVVGVVHSYWSVVDGRWLFWSVVGFFTAMCRWSVVFKIGGRLFLRKWSVVGGRCHCGRWSVVGGWSVGGAFVLCLCETKLGSSPIVGMFLF